MKRFSKIFCGVIPAVFAGVFAFISTGCIEDIFGNDDKVNKIVTSFGNRVVSVTFDANGGDVSFEKTDVNIGGTIAEFPEAERSGYDFIGWNTSAIGTGDYYDEDTAVVDGGLTLYAIWRLPYGTSVTVYLDYSKASEYGLSITNSPNFTVMAKIGYSSFNVSTLPTVNNSSAEFLGWFDAAGRQVVTSSKSLVAGVAPYTDEDGNWIGDSVRLYADWTPPFYIVNFNANGGTGTMNAVLSEESVDLPANAFEKDGYKFAGWNTKADGTGTRYADKQKGLKLSVSLYAVWIDASVEADVGYFVYSDGTVSYYEPSKTLVGIVFAVSGNTAKAISLQEEKMAWCIKAAEGYSKTFDSTSKSDGSGNWQIICDGVSDEDVAGNYPAFEYVGSFGEGWYLPAVEEAYAFASDKTNRPLLNAILEGLINAGISASTLNGSYYWTSSCTGSKAYEVYPTSSVPPNYNSYERSYADTVRAIKVFTIN